MSSHGRNGKIESPIESITVGGFKSIVNETTIAIKPLTILAGANSSGKSSMIQPILMLKQTLEAPYDPGPLLINGPHVNFTKVQQFRSKQNESSNKSYLHFKVTYSNGKYFSSNFAFANEEPISIQEFAYSFNNNRVIISSEGSNVTVETGHSNDLFHAGLANNPDKYKCVKYKFYYIFQSYGANWDIVTAYGLFNALDAIHVQGIRGNPLRLYPKVYLGDKIAGPFDPYVASILASREYHLQNKQVDEDLTLLRLTSKAEASAVDDASVEIRVGRINTPDSDMVNIADVGFGVSQVLPVVVALLVAKENQFVYIEQPELHLHPKAQYAMAQLLARAAKRGVRVVIETHSSILLLGIQELVAKGELPGDDVALHWFTRDEKTGVTTVDSRALDDAGRFGDWPADFDDTLMTAQMSYLNASEARLANS